MKQIIYLTILSIMVFITISYAGPSITYNTPNQHIIFYANTCNGIMTVIIPKGSLNPNEEHGCWDTLENFFKQEKQKLEMESRSRKFLERHKKTHPEEFGKKQPI